MWRGCRYGRQRLGTGYAVKVWFVCVGKQRRGDQKERTDTKWPKTETRTIFAQTLLLPFPFFVLLWRVPVTRILPERRQPGKAEKEARGRAYFSRAREKKKPRLTHTVSVSTLAPKETGNESRCETLCGVSISQRGGGVQVEKNCGLANPGTEVG